MPCRYAGGNYDRSEKGIDPGKFQRTALVIGGKEALTTTITRQGEPELYPEDPLDVQREGSQHTWTVGAGECPVDHGGESESAGGCPAHGDADAESPDRTGDDHDGGEHAGSDAGHDQEVDESPSPEFHLLFRLHYLGSDPESDRETVETAFSELESAFGWGPDGLVFSMGYTPAYFERFDASMPAPIADATAGEKRVIADGGHGHDAVLHVASDDVRNLLAAEAALWGEETVVDLSLPETFEGVFSRPLDPPERRATVAGGQSVVPDGTAEVATEGWLQGGAVQQVVTLPPVEPEEDAEDAEECPAHESEEDSSDGHGESEGGCPAHDGDHDSEHDDHGSESHHSDGSEHGDGGGCPAHGDDASQEETTTDEDGPADGFLLGVNPADPAELRVRTADGAPGPFGYEDVRDRSTYLVPPVSERSLPVPEGS